MHVVMELLADVVPPIPAGGPDLTDFKLVLARIGTVLILVAIASLIVLLVYHALQHMFGGEEGAMRSKAGFRRVLIGFAGVVLAAPIAGIAYWIFGDAIAKRLAGG